MKLKLVLTIIAALLLIPAFAQSQDMDKELVTLSDKLAKLIKENDKKKVTVLDFTDLQGGSSELGKYIAEELTVNLVIAKQGFSVLDRANLRKILSEHKLTASGLVDPENAKKLGMFAGVDAMIIGTIIPKGEKLSLNAKIITTDTAEIIGATRAEFKADENVEKLASTAAGPDTGDGSSSSPPKKLFGDLQAKVESVKLLPGDNYYGFARLTLVITNASATVTYGVGLNPNFYNNFNLTNDRGDEFKTTEVSGIETAYGNDGAFYGNLTDIPPRSSITLVAKSQVAWKGKPGDYRPYRLQTDFIFGAESKGRHPELQKFNFVTDIK